MENPLTEEQIIELNEIIKLDKEEQKVRLQSFLKTLNKEQLEFLQKSQQRECLFCSIANNKIKNYRIYEDNEFIVVLDIKGVNEGQCLLLPRKHVAFSFNIDNRVWDIINKVVLKLYEEFNCGTNIFIANGGEAGQFIGHFSIAIIPRFKDDKVNFNFVGEMIEEEGLRELSERLKIEEFKEEIKEEEYDYEEEERVP